MKTAVSSSLAASIESYLRRNIAVDVMLTINPEG